jgi:ADP-ribose pyrophosphatase
LSLEKPEFTANDVELIENDPVWQGFYRLEKVRLRHRLFAGGWSGVFEREVLLRGSSAGVLLYDPDLDKVVLVEQFRIGVMRSPKAAGRSPWLLELVAGMLDEDEEAADNVMREAVEEACCEITELLPITQYFNSPGGSDEYISLFCGRVDASAAEGVHGLPDENEDIRVHALGFDEAWQAMLDGRLDNAMAIIAMQWLWINRSDVRRKWLTGRE